MVELYELKTCKERRVSTCPVRPWGGKCGRKTIDRSRLREKEQEEEAHKKMVHKKCEYGRQRSRCKDCVGSSICEKSRRRSLCRKCGGSSLCEHGRWRSACKDCGGLRVTICVQRHIQSYCEDCGGGQLQKERRQRHLSQHRNKREPCSRSEGSETQVLMKKK